MFNRVPPPQRAHFGWHNVFYHPSWPCDGRASLQDLIPNEGPEEAPEHIIRMIENLLREDEDASPGERPEEAFKEDLKDMPLKNPVLEDKDKSPGEVPEKSPEESMPSDENILGRLDEVICSDELNFVRQWALDHPEEELLPTQRSVNRQDELSNMIEYLLRDTAIREFVGECKVMKVGLEDFAGDLAVKAEDAGVREGQPIVFALEDLFGHVRVFYGEVQENVVLSFAHREEKLQAWRGAIAEVRTRRSQHPRGALGSNL